MVLSDIPPVLLGFLRFFLAGLLLMASDRSYPLQNVAVEDRRSFFKLAFWGVFLLIIGMNYGLIWAPGIAASLLSGTPPLFTIVLASPILGEKMRPAQFLSIFLAISGMAFLGGDFSISGQENWKTWVGCLLTLVPQFSWAMYGITGKQLSSQYHWKTICRDTFFLGALMLAPVALIETAFLGIGHWSVPTAGILLYLALMNSVVTYSLWNSALGMISVSLASFLIYLQPISGAALSFFLFGESLGFKGAVGTGLIFLALTIVLLPEKLPITEESIAESSNAG
jgi:drug/metabolite transporter (DMT)-like permease